jgi:hypothetical protein
MPKLSPENPTIVKKCVFVSGCAYPVLITSYEDCISKYLERFSNLMRRLEKRKNAAHSWNILQQSLSLNQTIGDLLLSLEQLDITLSIEFLDRCKHFMAPNEQQHSRGIQQHQLFLLENQDLRHLQDFYGQVKQGPIPMVGPLLKLVRTTCEDLQCSTFAILFHPIKEQLNLVDSEEMMDTIWMSSSAGTDTIELDLPDFSFSPQVIF